MQKFVVAVVMSGVVLLESGCASIVSKSQWPVTINSNPSGATVTIRNKKGIEIQRGTTPMTVTLPSKAGFYQSAAYQFAFEKEGYYPANTTLSANLNGWYFGNIVFGIGSLVSAGIVDPATGAMWKLDDMTCGNLYPDARAKSVVPGFIPSQVVALNQNTSLPESERAIIINDTSPGVGVALVVGINKYDTLGELDSCQQDAVAIKETLVKYGGYNPNRVILITDNTSARESTASYANITRRIDQICKLAKPKDTLLIYFAGHGITVDNEMFLVPQDGGEPRTSIPVDWVRQEMGKSAAAGMMLVLDACHSGKATRGVSGIVPSKFSKQGILTLSSCADNELSYQEGKHGVFTGFLLAGLQGPADADKDNQVSSGELFRFIQANMEGWSMRSGKTQRPQISDETANLIIGRRTPKSDN